MGLVFLALSQSAASTWYLRQTDSYMQRKKSGPIKLFSSAVSGILSCTFLIALISISTSLTFAQRVYEGPHQLTSNLSGTAIFQFEKVGNDTIYNGEFSFFSAERTGENDEILTGRNYFGIFKQGKKDGNWTYEFKRFETEATPVLRGYDIVKPGTGEDRFISGTFRDGIAHGPWKVLHQKISRGEASDSLLSARAQLSNGQFSGRIYGVFPEVKVNGAFDVNGMLHDTWKIQHVLDDGIKLEEFRVYQNGKFIKHYFELLGQQFEVLHSGFDTTEDENEVWEDIPVSPTYFNLIYHSTTDVVSSAAIAVPEELEGDKAKDFISITNDYLKSLLFSFSQDNGTGVWDELPGSEPIATGMLRLRVYDYPEEDLKKLRKARDLYKNSQKIIQAFFKDTQIDISRHSYEEINYFYKVMAQYDYSSRQLGEVAKMLTHDAFKYVDREVVYEKIAPEIEYPDSVQYEFKDEVYTRHFDFPEIAKINGHAAYLHDHLSVIHMDLIQIEEQIGKTLEQYKKQSQLAELEKSLVEKRDSVAALYKNQFNRADFNEYHQRLSTQIIELVEHEFRSYANEKLEVKLSLIDAKLECISSALKVYEMQTKIPTRIDQIDELYTRTVWSPYTMTYMDERLKERVYRAYETVLIPLVLDDMENNISCETLLVKQKNMVKLYQKMLNIREQDTRDIERELRRETNPHRVMEILELNLDLN